MAHEYTQDEIRKKFLGHIWNFIEYWDTHGQTSRDKLEGLAFSIMSMLDGSTMEFPKFMVAPDPCPDDKDFHDKNGENWFPPSSKGDVGGSLHDSFFKERPSEEK